MIYNKFRIKNFKGISEVEIDLSNNRIITLVGLNESGKTTIMEAINLFYKVIAGEKPSTEELNQFRPKGIAFTDNIEVEATILLEKQDKDKINNYWKKDLGKRSELDIPEEFTYSFKFEFKLHSYKETKTICDFNVKRKTSKNLYNINKQTWGDLIRFIKENIVPEILYYDDFMFEILDSVCFVKEGITEDENVIDPNNKRWQSVITDILNAVNTQLTFQEHVVDLWETDYDAASNRLSQMERVLDEKITSKWSDLFKGSKVNFKEIKLDPKYSNGKLCLSFKIRTQTKHEFLVNERSKGFRWFFSFLLFTEFRKKRTYNILFLLDEPASNLHSSAQAKILEAVNELSKDSLVIYSTHSHHLINPEWLSGAYICINENLSEETLSGGLDLSEGAKITAIKYYTYVGLGMGSDKISYFQPILDRLDYKPSTVEPIPGIIITEGKNDWYTFKYFDEVIFKNKYNLNFYPGAGKDKLWDIIRLYLAWGKNFLVVLDGDSGGGKSKKKYEDEFGDFIKNKIFTLKDILNLNDTSEALIAEDDKRLIYESIFGKETGVNPQ